MTSETGAPLSWRAEQASLASACVSTGGLSTPAPPAHLLPLGRRWGKSQSLFKKKKKSKKIDITSSKKAWW